MDVGENATREMLSKAAVVGESNTISGKRIGDRTRAAWRLFRPVVRNTTWWVLLAAAVLMVMWEVDDLWSGTIYDGLGWLRQNVLKRFPIIPFGLGMMVYHFVLRSGRGDQRDS